jgi:hypothetical protein
LGFQQAAAALRAISSVAPWMQIFISVAILLASLFIVLSKLYDTHDKHWAFTTLGMVIRFWLRIP